MFFCGMMSYNRIFALVLIVPPAFAGSNECAVNTAPGEDTLPGDTGIYAFYEEEVRETQNDSFEGPAE